MLNDVFGKPNGNPHENTWAFEHADGGGLFVNMDDHELQEHFRKQQGQRKALLSAYIEQLTDQVGEFAPPPPQPELVARSLKKPKELRTTFSTYQVNDVIGEGGAGLVYSAKDEDGRAVAIKILNPAKATREKMKRFKNEFRFCAQSKHPNIVSVHDDGLTPEGASFFVMPLYTCSLRKLIGTFSSKDAFAAFIKILDGVDAAHKQGVTHRDLKPENILVSPSEGQLVISDFGIADFEEDDLYSTVETKVGAHIGNFQYAAPEQRARGRQIDKRADIYSLGLILNELFTSELALGVNFKNISSVDPDYAYLDPIVLKMLEQSPSSRYANIDELKLDLSARCDEQISRQKLSKLNGQVIPVGEVDDPIVAEPMRIIGVDWENGTLTIELNHVPNKTWIWAMNNMGGHTAVYGRGPETFRFSGNKAVVHASENEAQLVINHFKNWLLTTSRVYVSKLERDLQESERKARDEIKRRIAEEEKRMKVKGSLTF